MSSRSLRCKGQRFLGRSHVLCGRLAEARAALERSIALARDADWLGFVPWPEAWLGEVDFAEDRVDSARNGLEHAFALGCELGDPCWEGMSAQGLGRIATHDGETAQGLRLLEDARRRAGRVPCAYVWVEAYALTGLAAAAVESGSSHAEEWISDLESVAARTGMREFAVRAALLRHARGERGAQEAARVLAREVQNPALAAEVGSLPVAA